MTPKFTTFDVSILMTCTFILGLITTMIFIYDKPVLCPPCINDVNIPSTMCNYTTSSRTYFESSSIPPFITIVQAVAQAHQYDINTYNCRDFTYQSVKTLRELGYSADYCRGWLLQDGKKTYHAFGKITTYFEATNGRYITPEDFESQYTLEACDNSIIFKGIS